MIAVAIVAIVLAIEIELFDLSKRMVSDLGDGTNYIPGEAAAAWAIFQIPILLTFLVITFVVRGIYRNR
jgi:hypothetical protein